MLMITGAGGQLGKAAVERCRKADIDFISADRTELDITNKDAIASFVRDKNIDCILNCAAYTAVDAAEEHVGEAYAVNAYAPHCLAITGIPLIHVSTDYVFDGRSDVPYETDAKTNPLSVYGLSKRAGETALLESGQKGLIVRTAWVYSSDPETRNFYNTMKRLGKTHSEVRVVSDQFGTPTLADDLADALVRLYEQGSFKREMQVLHFTNSGSCSWFDFASAIIGRFNPACRVVPIATSEYPTKAVRPGYSVMSLKSMQNIGINPRSWQDALASTFLE